MQNGDEALPSIILAGRALLMKMFIPLEPLGIFCSDLGTIVFQHFPTAGMRKSDEHQFGQSSSFSENAKILDRMVYFDKIL